jgi:hypothetical protein
MTGSAFLLPSPWMGEGPGLGVGEVQNGAPPRRIVSGAAPIPTLPPSKGKG